MPEDRKRCRDRPREDLPTDRTIDADEKDFHIPQTLGRNCNEMLLLNNNHCI